MVGVGFSDLPVGVIWLFWVCYTGNPNMVMALAGNKADLEDKRKVTAEVSAISLLFTVTWCSLGSVWTRDSYYNFLSPAHLLVLTVLFVDRLLLPFCWRVVSFLFHT